MTPESISLVVKLLCNAQRAGLLRSCLRIFEDVDDTIFFEAIERRGVVKVLGQHFLDTGGNQAMVEELRSVLRSYRYSKRPSSGDSKVAKGSDVEAMKAVTGWGTPFRQFLFTVLTTGQLSCTHATIRRLPTRAGGVSPATCG